MSVDRRSLSSAANGRRSKGPVTVEGKERSSRNAIRHGLLAQCLVIQGESVSAFKRVHDDHILHFQPANEIELEAVEEYTSAVWRLRRSWAIESRLFDDAAPDRPGHTGCRMASAFQTCADSPALALMNRYQTRLENLQLRTLRKLRLLRSDFPTPPDGHTTNPFCMSEQIVLEPASVEPPVPGAEHSDLPVPEKVELPNEPTLAANQPSPSQEQPHFSLAGDLPPLFQDIPPGQLLVTLTPKRSVEYS